jgi:hypothetical protein
VGIHWEFDAGVGGGELPIGSGVAFVAIFLPRGNSLGQNCLTGDTAVEASADRKLISDATHI